MPIGDLLAEISGEKSSSTPTTSRAPSSVGIKRKPSGDANGASKVSRARYDDGPGAGSAGSRNSHSNVVREAQPITRSIPSRPYPAAKPVSSMNAQRPGPSTNARPYAGTSAPNRPNGRPTPLPSASTRQPNAPPAKPSRPSPTTPTVAESSKAPKKGSFAEIMARGAKAQQVMPKAGAIQHKPMEKALSKKERLEKASGKGKFAKKTAESGRPLNDMSRNSARPANGSKLKPGDKNRPPSSGSDVPEKKMKKSAMATTGYTGTARPRPAAAATKTSSTSRNRPGPSRTAGGLLAPPKPRRNPYEDEDEEDDEDLDDFVVDDEDDGPPRAYGYGGGYESDQSSDMEAGYDDVESEETRAERAAREEDRREKALEEKLKREKERRKRMGQ